MAVKKQDTIFTELRYALNLVSNDLNSVKPVYKRENIRAIKKLRDFIMSGEWSNAKSVKNLLLYIDMSSAEASEKTKQAKSTIRTQRANASKLIKHLLGDDVIENCLSSEPDKVNAVLNRIKVVQMLNKPIDNYVSTDIIEKFRMVKNVKVYDLDDCETEIKVLAALSVLHKERLLSGVDEKKMSYLMSLCLQPKVIGKDKKPNIEQAELIELIEKEEMNLSALLFSNNDDSESMVADNSFTVVEFSDGDLCDDSFLEGGLE